MVCHKTIFFPFFFSSFCIHFVMYPVLFWLKLPWILFFTFPFAGVCPWGNKPKTILEDHPSRVTLWGHLLRWIRAWERAEAELFPFDSHFEQIWMREARGTQVTKSIYQPVCLSVLLFFPLSLSLCNHPCITKLQSFFVMQNHAKLFFFAVFSSTLNEALWL